MADFNEQGPLGGLTPHITTANAPAAIDFYKAAFGATEMSRMVAEDGKRLMHAHLLINGASLMMHDDFPEYRGGTALPDPTGVTLHLQVDDADAWFTRAVAAGAVVVMPLENMFWGDRFGQVKDPSGHIWSIAHSVSR